MSQSLRHTRSVLIGYSVVGFSGWYRRSLAFAKAFVARLSAFFAGVTCALTYASDLQARQQGHGTKVRVHLYRSWPHW